MTTFLDTRLDCSPRRLDGPASECCCVRLRDGFCCVLDLVDGLGRGGCGQGGSDDATVDGLGWKGGVNCVGGDGQVVDCADWRGEGDRGVEDG